MIFLSGCEGKEDESLLRILELEQRLAEIESNETKRDDFELEIKEDVIDINDSIIILETEIGNYENYDDTEIKSIVEGLQDLVDNYEEYDDTELRDLIGDLQNSLININEALKMSVNVFYENSGMPVVVRTTFDENDMIKQIAKYHYISPTQIMLTQVDNFNEDDTILRLEFYENGNVHFDKSFYVYEGLTKILSSNTYSEDGSLRLVEDYKYDDFGNMIILNSINFHDNGEISSEAIEEYYPGGIPKTNSYKYYNEQGIIVSEFYNEYYNNYLSKILSGRHYDENGNLEDEYLQEFYYNGAFKFKYSLYITEDGSVFLFEKSYDNNGVMTLEVYENQIYESGFLKFTEVETTSYYKNSINMKDYIYRKYDSNGILIEEIIETH